MYFYDPDYNPDLSRLDFAKFIDFGQACLTTRNSFFVNELKKLPSVDVFPVRSEAGRPDVISYKIYRSFQYYWIILLYNDILFYDEIELGDELRYPAMDDVETLYFDTIRQGVRL